MRFPVRNGRGPPRSPPPPPAPRAPGPSGLSAMSDHGVGVLGTALRRGFGSSPCTGVAEFHDVRLHRARALGREGAEQRVVRVMGSARAPVRGREVVVAGEAGRETARAAPAASAEGSLNKVVRPARPYEEARHRFPGDGPRRPFRVGRPLTCLSEKMGQTSLLLRHGGRGAARLRGLPGWLRHARLPAGVDDHPARLPGGRLIHRCRTAPLAKCPRGDPARLRRCG